MTEQDHVLTKCAWRLVPFMTLLYVVNWIDRVNVGFAALTMNKELGFSPSIYGFGAGIFFFSYALCQVPASMMIARIGPIGIIFCMTGVQLWVPQIVQAMGFPNEMVGAVVAVPFLCATAAMILWGYASDLRKERIWHIASAALFTVLGLIISSISTSYLFVLLGLTIAIVGQFSALPVVNTLLPSVLRGPALAGGVALYNTMAQFGGFFSPIVIGVLKEETNGYAAGLIALAVAMTSSAIAILALGRALSPRAVSANIVHA